MQHGPIYCETGHPWLFMAEPVNTITNAFIVLAAVLAFLEVRRAKSGWPVNWSVPVLSKPRMPADKNVAAKIFSSANLSLLMIVPRHPAPAVPDD